MIVKNKTLELGIVNFKAKDDEKMSFTCYGNTKGNIDHAMDRSIDGVYSKSIKAHVDNGTMPKMLWMHDPKSLPIGKWVSMKEDAKGLMLEGEFANTERGREVYTLMKSGALDSFSIGYRVIQEKWNAGMQCNDLVEVDIKEISVVNFACNEESRLVNIKSKIDDGDLPTKRDLQKFLHEAGLSNRQAEKVANKYNPDHEKDIFELMAEVQ